MKNLKIIIAIAVVLIFCSCKFNVAVLKSSEDIIKMKNELKVIKSIRRAMKYDSLIIKERDGTIKVLACDSVWGIKYMDGTVYRNFEDQYFLLRQNSDIVIYSQSHGGYKSSTTSYYFSKELNSKIYPLKQKTIEREFANDTCFLNKLDREIKWYQDFTTYDRRQKTYLIVKLLKECKK